MKIRLLSLFIMTACILAGCQIREKKGNITFIKEDKIEYSHDFKVSDLIEKVDGYEKKDFKIDDKKIVLPNGKTVAINTTNRKIELDTIKFTFRYANKNFTKEVLIQDTIAPKIKCEDTYKVLIHNMYFKLDHLIDVEDNYSKDEKIDIYFNGNYDINEAGTYEVEVLAYDEKKNKAKKKIKIIVEKEKNKEQITQEKPVNDYVLPNKNSEHNNSNSNTGNNGGGVTVQKPPVNNYVPQSRTFTIDTYATFDECYAACQSYISECMSKGYHGVATAEPIKREGVYIGYQAVFK